MKETESESHLSYRIAAAEEEIDEITQLVTRMYVQRGYLDPKYLDGDTPEISSYLSSPHATVFGAYADDDVVGTIAVVDDASPRLPMDMLFEEELNLKRQDGAKIAEVCQFAVDKQLIKQTGNSLLPAVADIEVSTHLLRLVIHYGIHRRFDFFSFAVDRKHKLFYEAIGCVQIGTGKQYPSVNNTTAFGYLLDVKKIEQFINAKTQKTGFLRKIMQTQPNYALFENAR